MAVRLPIIVDYNGKGLQKLKREFDQLDGVAAKTKFALKKALIPATAAFGAVTKIMGDSISAAALDEQAQIALARTIKQTTGATDKQIKANEDWISTQGKLFGVTDDDLRPALAKLVRVTKDVQKAQKYASLAMDVAAGTGKDLNDVTDAFSKALGGNMKSLRALAPEVGNLIKKGATADQVFQQLASTFGGQAKAQADTAAGKFQILRVRMDELKESIGARLLPIVEDQIIPALQKFSDWADKHPELFKTLALGITAIAGATIALNLAMAANPWVLFIAGLVGLVYWLVKTETLLKSIIKLKEAISGTQPGNWMRQQAEQFNTLRSQMQSAPRDGQTGLSGDMGSSRTMNMTINVNGGDPKATVDAIVRWSRQNGALPPQVQLSR